MGFFEKIFGRRETEASRKAREQFKMLTGYAPAFHTWQGSVFESELIRAALDAHGRHAAKLTPVLEGSAKPNLRNRLSYQPNAWQTWPQFLYKTAVCLYTRNTAFIVPVYGEYGEINGIIPITPERWELVEYKGDPWVRFYLSDNKRAAVELWNVGILTRYQYRSELFGEDNDALRETLDLITIQQQGIQEAVKNGASFRFMAVSSNWSKDEDLARETKRFAKDNLSADSGGVILFPNTYKDIKQIDSKAYTVDADQVKLIKENVYDYFGVNESVIQNKAYGDEWAAFYTGAIEWFAINLSDAVTRMLFTERERSHGNKILFTANRLEYMSNANKLDFAKSMSDRGLLMRNEIRALFNLPPLPEPYGSQIPARGEYYNLGERETPAETTNDTNNEEADPDAGENQ